MLGSAAPAPSAARPRLAAGAAWQRSGTNPSVRRDSCTAAAARLDNRPTAAGGRVRRDQTEADRERLHVARTLQVPTRLTTVSSAAPNNANLAQVNGAAETMDCRRTTPVKPRQIR